MPVSNGNSLYGSALTLMKINSPQPLCPQFFSLQYARLLGKCSGKADSSQYQTLSPWRLTQVEPAYRSSSALPAV